MRAGWTLAFSVPLISLAQSPPPEPVRSAITVIAQVAAESPASITTPNVDRSPGVNLDDRLRLVPGFTLFRRTSSVTANPTTQGVSLRGLGATGASRTLVLWDGVPLNDPFGGWVYWTRIDPGDIGRVEISRGASTSVFGDRAIGGAISLFPRDPAPLRFTGAYEFGNRNTHQASAGYSHLASRWAASAGARAFTTNGYFIVPESSRGPIDTEAALRFLAANARGDYLGAHDRVFLRADILTEERPNGTRLQHNSTGLGMAAAQWHHEAGPQSLSLTGYHSREEFRSSFSAIGPGRLTERLTGIQSVPAESTGGAALWRRSAARWNALAGADAVRVEGYSLETSGVTGGTQLQHGYFAQGDAAAGPLRFFAGARVHSPGEGRVFFSPSAGLTAGMGRWRARASAYRALRAPTLNELYRQFRVGNVVTRANAALRPEAMWGAEAGADFQGESSRVSVTAFRNSLSSLISNVTISSTPQLIVRQRQNAAAAVSQGVEIDALRRWRSWSGEASYLFADSRFDTGPRVPQIARHQGSASLTWARGGTLVSGGIRALSLQFEDDRNDFLLPGFAVFHATAQQRLRGPLSLVAALENAFDRVYSAGFSPTPLTGAPRLWRIGLRWKN